MNDGSRKPVKLVKTQPVTSKHFYFFVAKLISLLNDTLKFMFANCQSYSILSLTILIKMSFGVSLYAYNEGFET